MGSDLVLSRYLDPGSVRVSILADNYSELPWPSMRGEAVKVEQGFDRIIDSDDGRAHFVIPEQLYEHDERGEELEIGFLKKRTGGTKTDLTPLEIAEGRTRYDGNKYRFHFGQDLLDHLGPEKQLRHEYRIFLSACARFNAAAYNIALRLGAEFDRYNAGDLHRRGHYSGSLFQRLKGGKAFTRLLRYEQLEGVSPDAALHRDRSCFTIHWLSSHPGRSEERRVGKECRL